MIIISINHSKLSNWRGRKTYTTTSKVSNTNSLLPVAIFVNHNRFDILVRVEDSSTPLQLGQLLREWMARVHDNAVPFAAVDQELWVDGVELGEDGFDLGGLEGFLGVGERGKLSRRGEALGVAHREDGVWDRHFECCC